jgi:hypothetical protein
MQVTFTPRFFEMRFGQVQPSGSFVCGYSNGMSQLLNFAYVGTNFVGSIVVDAAFQMSVYYFNHLAVTGFQRDSGIRPSFRVAQAPAKFFEVSAQSPRRPRHRGFPPHGLRAALLQGVPARLDMATSMGYWASSQNIYSNIEIFVQYWAGNVDRTLASRNLAFFNTSIPFTPYFGMADGACTSCGCIAT